MMEVEYNRLSFETLYSTVCCRRGNEIKSQRFVSLSLQNENAQGENKKAEIFREKSHMQFT